VDIGFDRYLSYPIVQHLMDEGLEMVEFGQGFHSMSYPTKELERRVLAREIAHGANPVLRWMMSNVQVKEKADEADNIKPDKKASGDRIDGIVALVMAIGVGLWAAIGWPVALVSVGGLIWIDLVIEDLLRTRRARRHTP
jgi:phage terminase large subunit-like protein